MSTIPVLFVVYDFPPEGSRGTKRSLKFIRYLPRNRWKPVVLTVKGANSCSHDDSLLLEIASNVAVYRARTLENPFRNGAHDHVETQAVAEANAPLPLGLRRAALWCYHCVGRFTSVPDSRILWLPFAVVMGFKIIRKHRCRVIYSSGPSHTNHVVGAMLSRLARLPLVIDFRDAWVGNPAEPTIRGWLKVGNAFLERFCVRSATFVVGTTDGIKADFERRYPDLPGKYLTITNGYDPSDFPPETSSRQHPHRRVMSIVHAGTLGRERSPEEFLLALGQLLREKPSLLKLVEVVFVGNNASFLDGRTIEDYVKEYGCGSVVKLTGFVSRKESLDYMAQADVLLLIIGRVPKAGAFVYGISGKIYDYAAARKPVLTVSEPGSTAEMAQRLNLGPVLHPDDTQQIKSAILSLLEAHQSGPVPYNPNLELLKSFEFSSLTARLAECFDKACVGKKGAAKGGPHACMSQDGLIPEEPERKCLQPGTSCAANEAGS